MKVLREIFAADIPFARDDAHRLLPAMIGCMVGFAALLLMLSITLAGGLAAQSRDTAGILQVEVPHELAKKPSAMERVLTELRNTAHVKETVVLDEREMEALLKPWLGSNFKLGDLPVPTIVDVQTAVSGGKTMVNTENLRARLQKVDSHIRLEDRGPWVEHMQRATSLLQALVLLVAGLLLACVVGMVVLVAKTNLKLHFKTVSLLHMFGATDEYILRQFQWNNALLAARGGLAGALIATLVFLTALVLSHRWQSPVLPAINFDFAHAMVLVLLPAFTAIIALLATRLTVQSMLRIMH